MREIYTALAEKLEREGKRHVEDGCNERKMNEKKEGDSVSKCNKVDFLDIMKEKLKIKEDKFWFILVHKKYT